MELFVKVGCPYSADVLMKADEIGVALTLKDIADPAVHAELLTRGGKAQTPYLVDAEHNVSMYESEAIITYLKNTYAQRSR